MFQMNSMWTHPMHAGQIFDHTRLAIHDARVLPIYIWEPELCSLQALVPLGFEAGVHTRVHKEAGLIDKFLGNGYGEVQVICLL